MAKTSIQLENKIRVKFCVKPKKWVLYWGNQQCKINGEYQKGFATQEEAISIGNLLKGETYYKTT